MLPTVSACALTSLCLGSSSSPSSICFHRCVGDRRRTARNASVQIQQRQPLHLQLNGIKLPFIHLMEYLFHSPRPLSSPCTPKNLKGMQVKDAFHAKTVAGRAVADGRSQTNVKGCSQRRSSVLAHLARFGALQNGDWDLRQTLRDASSGASRHLTPNRENGPPDRPCG